MTDDFVDRMRDLPPTLPDVPDRVDRVRRLVTRRRRRQVGFAAVATALAVVIPVAVVSGLPSGGHGQTGQHVLASRLATVAADCPAPGLSITTLPTNERMIRTAAQVREALAQQHTGGRIVAVYPALVKDPIAPKVGLGSGTTPRRMWVVYSVRTAHPAGGGEGHAAGVALTLLDTQIAQLTLVDDATLASGGGFGCKPISADRGNVGYGIAAGSQVGGTGTIGPAGSGFVLCFIGLPFQTLGGPGPGELSACSDQVALSGDTQALAHWADKNRYVRGTWQEGGLRVTSIGAPQPEQHSPFLTNPPCATPPGGWAHVAPSPTPDVDFAAYERYRRHHPGVAVTIEIFHPSRLAPVLTLGSVNPAATRSALAAAYPRQLCVVASRYTAAQVRAANRLVNRAFQAGRLPGVYELGPGVTSQGQASVDITAYSDRPTYRQVLSQLPPGMLRIQSWLRTLSAPPS